MCIDMGGQVWFLAKTISARSADLWLWIIIQWIWSGWMDRTAHGFISCCFNLTFIIWSWLNFYVCILVFLQTVFVSECFSTNSTLIAIFCSMWLVLVGGGWQGWQGRGGPGWQSWRRGVVWRVRCGDGDGRLGRHPTGCLHLHCRGQTALGVSNFVCGDVLFLTWLTIICCIWFFTAFLSVVVVKSILVLAVDGLRVLAGEDSMVFPHHLTL